MMRNRLRQHQGYNRPRRYGKWLLIALLLTSIAGFGKRVVKGRHPYSAVQAA